MIEIDAAKGPQPLGMSPAKFLREYWQKKPLLIRNAFPGYGSPLQPEDLAGLACEDGVLARLAAYRGELGAQRAALEAWAEQALWAEPAFIAAARAGLEAVDGALAGLEARARGARAGFEALPRLEQAGVAPAAVEHDALPE